MGDVGNSRKTWHLSEDSGKEQTSKSDHTRKILVSSERYRWKTKKPKYRTK